MKPNSEKTTKTLEVFSIREPIEQVEQIINGKRKMVWRYNTYYFTTADKPVTYEGIQYIPLSSFDQVRWSKVV